MDQKWVQRLVILVLYQQIASGDEPVKEPEVIFKTVKEGSEIEIKCQPGVGTMVVWFRVPEDSAMEFMGSFSPTGTEKKLHKDYGTRFDVRKIGKDFLLKLKSFQKVRDSGVYSCAYLHRGNELRFGDVTRLRGEEQQVKTDRPPTTTANRAPWMTTPPRCACEVQTKRGEAQTKRGEKASPPLCAPIILGPLAGSCGLLLLLLCITIFYCNRIRTRRCPHHHKRKPRMIPLEKQMMTNTHI